MSGDNSEREPPESISNSEVKTFSADDSLGFPHAKVGHCQAFITKERVHRKMGPFSLSWIYGMTYFQVGCSRREQKNASARRNAAKLCFGAGMSEANHCQAFNK